MFAETTKFLKPTCWLFLQLLGLCTPKVDDNSLAANPDIQIFQEYLRINTTTYGNFEPAIDFWKDLSEPLGLNVEVYEFSAGLPVIVIEWPGTEPTLCSIMLNSHVDVVPAVREGWKYGPFSATLDDEGVIWGRGTQDMKSVSIQYFLALKRLREKGRRLARPVFMTLMPDEEVGGSAGMVPFLESAKFASMNVGCAMDEGGASPYNLYALFYQDKAVWQIKVTCTGTAVHSATFPATNLTAVGKCRNVIDTFLDYRDAQYEISVSSGELAALSAGKFTTVNLNKLNAGTANNIVPSTVDLVFDIRLGTSVNTTAFLQQLNDWLSATGDGVTMEFLQKDHQSARTVTTASNPYYVALQTAAKELNITMVPIVSPGATDSRYVRLKNIPAFGFSPMANTETLPHTVNERLSGTTFLDGIAAYETIISTMANIPDSATRGLSSSSLVVQSEE